MASGCGPGQEAAAAFAVVEALDEVEVEVEDEDVVEEDVDDDESLAEDDEDEDASAFVSLVAGAVPFPAERESLR